MTMNRLSYLVNNLVGDDLSQLEARSSATMLLLKKFCPYQFMHIYNDL